MNENQPEATKRKKLEEVQRLIDRCGIVAAVSQHTLRFATQHLDLSGKRQEVIHNGFNPTPAEPVDPGFAVRPFLLSMGSFFERKNVHVLLPLMHKYPHLTLVLAGYNNTPYGERVKYMVRQQNLEQRVILPGEISESAKVWLYVAISAMFGVCISFTR
jgi:glycosyltransferase involved in cell wall biosynthesis